MAERQRWFFSLPQDTKHAIKRNPANSRGWFNDEFTKQRLDWKECVDIGVEGRADSIDGTNQWLSSDTEADAFRSAMLEYFDAVTGQPSKRKLRYLLRSVAEKRLFVGQQPD